MDGFWAERSLQPERMDLESLDSVTAARVLRALEKVNTWLGGVQATLHHLRRYARSWQPGERVRFVDWGTGGADLPRALVRWGRRNGFKFEIAGVDSNPAVLDYARQACRDYPEIKLIPQNFLAPDLSLGAPFDYAISSLCLHHLTDQEIVGLLQKSDRLAGRGLIMNDLKRSIRAWTWIWALTRLGSAHPIVKNDAPLSVRRAFRPPELAALAARAGVSYLKVSTHFGYRLVLAGEKRTRRYGDGETGGNNDTETPRRGDTEMLENERALFPVAVSPRPRVFPSPRHDVAVIGGGPAGSAAAIRLAQIGMKVRLYEKKRFPRAKLCGGFISSEALQDLEQLGIMASVNQAGAVPIRRTVVSSSSGALAEAPLPSLGLSLSRERLDASLLQAARDAGVDVREGTDGAGHEREAAWTVIANGRHADLSAARRTRWIWGQGDTAQYGLQAWFENIPGVSDQVELDRVNSGYVGLIRQGVDRVNLCALTSKEIFAGSGASPDAVLASWRRQNPRLNQLLDGARRVGGWSSIGPVRMGIRRLTEPGRLFAGDAACVVDPFAGEGIAMALRSASLIQQAFRQTALPIEQAYETAWRQTFSSVLRFHQLTRQILKYRWLNEPTVRGLRSFPSLLTFLTARTRPEIHANLQPHPDRSAV